MATNSKKKKYLKKIEKKPADFSKEGMANASERAKKRYNIVSIVFGILITLLALGAIVTIICPYIDLGDDFQEIKGYEMITGLKGTFMADNQYLMFNTNIILIIAFVLTIAGGVLATVFKGQWWVKISTALCFVVAAIVMFLIVPVFTTSATDTFMAGYKLLDPAQYCVAPYVVGCGYMLCAFLAFFKDDFAKMTIKNIM